METTEKITTGNNTSGNTAPRISNAVPSPKGVPVFGNFLSLKPKQLHVQLKNWCDRFGSIYSYKVGPTELHVVSDLALIHEMLKRRPHDFRRTKRIEVIFKELGVHGVF